MTMHIPPRLQGPHAVQVSFGADADYVYKRVYDQSDRTTRWYRADWGQVDRDSYDPANEVPDEPRGGWEPCSEPMDEE